MANALQILHTENARISFMKGIIELAKVAGIEDSEVVFFQQAMDTLGITGEVKEELKDLLYKKALEVEFHFENKNQGLFFLREGVQLCYVDGHYQEEEKSLIRQMANQLGISLDNLAKIERWVLEGLEWSRQGDELLYLEV